jgi:hypothetical protein
LKGPTVTQFHDHEYCITDEGVMPGCPNFGEQPGDEHRFDVTGQSLARYSKIRTEWAVVIDGLLSGRPGPHVLGIQDEREALDRLAAWQADRPTANARLIRREVTETSTEWSSL